MAVSQNNASYVPGKQRGIVNIVNFAPVRGTKWKAGSCA